MEPGGIYRCLAIASQLTTIALTAEGGFNGQAQLGRVLPITFRLAFAPSSLVFGPLDVI